MNDANKNPSDPRHFRSVSSGLETDKKNLERERDRLLRETEAANSQAQQLTQMVETINNTLQTKEETLLSKRQQLQKKDELIAEKDQKIEEYRQQFMEMGEEKAQYQKEKFEFMEKLNSEKMEMIEKIGNLEKTIQADEQKIAKLREKSKNAEDGLLGIEYGNGEIAETIAKLNAQIQGNNPEAPIKEGATEESRPNKEVGSKQDKKKISELEAYIADLTSKIDELKNVAPGEAQNSGETKEDVFGKGTGIYKSVSALTTHFKFKIGNPQQLIRLMVPSIGDLNRYNLMESLNGLTG